MTNIILISLDTTRADRLSCYGHYRHTSPALDRVAAAGALFEEHFSPHIPTYPGHTTLLSGTDMFGHGVTGQSGAFEPVAGVLLLPEILQSAGYYTAAADNLNRWFARGVERYVSYEFTLNTAHHWRRGESVAESACERLREAANQLKPFYLFVHFWDAHTPYLPPPPFDRMFYSGNERDPSNSSMDAVWRFEPFRDYFAEWMPGVTDIQFPISQYDASIAYMDCCLSTFLCEIDRLCLTDDTLLVITADHGEDLDEHAHWFDHHGLYDTNLHIPLIMRLPGKVIAGSRIRGFTRSIDVAPTILDLLGVDANGRDQMMGRSLVPLLDGSPISRGSADVIHATENTWMKKRAIRTHLWKLIVPLETPDLHGRSERELYDLAADPGELTNLAADMLEVTRALEEQMASWVRDRLENTGRPDPLIAQPIPLRRIGTSNVSAAEQTHNTKPPGDEKSRAGDFVGYERKPRD